MNKIKRPTSEKPLGPILEELKGMREEMGKMHNRIEEILVDSTRFRFDVTAIKLNTKLSSHDISIIKHDIEDVKENGEKTRKELSKKIDNLAREIQDLTENNKLLFHKSVTLKEHNQLEARVTLLEQQ